MATFDPQSSILPIEVTSQKKMFVKSYPVSIYFPFLSLFLFVDPA